MKNIYLFSLGVLFLVFLDQFSKYLIRYNDGFYICNTGIAFGIQIPQWTILILITTIIILAFFFFLNNFDRYYIFLPIAFLFIISGAISNLTDRLIYGCVIDFINIKLFNYPLFNLADTFIVIGAIISMYQILKTKDKK